MRPSAPTRLLIGVCLIWVTGRVLGVTLAAGAGNDIQLAVAPVASGGPSLGRHRDIVAHQVGKLSGRFRPVHAALVRPPVRQMVATPSRIQQFPLQNMDTAIAVKPAPASAGGAAAIANAQFGLLQRLTGRRPVYALAPRWQWRGNGEAMDFAAAPRSSMDRWRLSMWGVVRDGSAPTTGLAPASLGGSQIGARLAYRIDRGGRWEAFARASSAGRVGDGVEGAVGVAWQPIAAIPARLSMERRQRLVGSDARNDFAAYISGGVSQRPIATGWRLDGYGAAGVVGVRDPLPFAEAQIAATHAIIRRGRVALAGGGGIWAAAQSDVARVDVGPRLSLDAGAGVPRVALDWRQRVAGNAAPASGPTLTVGMDF